jgi:hypothetical protein
MKGRYVQLPPTTGEFGRPSMDMRKCWTLHPLLFTYLETRKPYEGKTFRRWNMCFNSVCSFLSKHLSPQVTLEVSRDAPLGLHVKCLLSSSDFTQEFGSVAADFSNIPRRCVSWKSIHRLLRAHETDLVKLTDAHFFFFFVTLQSPRVDSPSHSAPDGIRSRLVRSPSLCLSFARIFFPSRRRYWLKCTKL